MPSDIVYVAEGSPAATSSPVSGVLVPSVDKATTTSADPGTSGTTLAVTANALFPGTNGYKVRVIGTSGIAEIMLVTAGAGTNSWTVTRGQDGTTGVAHSIGATVSLVEFIQNVYPLEARRIVTYKGRFSTFKTPGRAAVSQKIAAIHNATGSTVIVKVNRIKVDMLSTVAKAVTVIPPLLRVVRFTAVPTNGTAGTKVPFDTSLASNSAVTVWMDASADDTGSATTLTCSPTAGAVAGVLAETFAPRMISAAGYEMIDVTEFFVGDPDVELRALEGLCVFLDAATVTTGNPATDSWVASVDWEEYRVT